LDDVKGWNAWRIENPGKQIELLVADLRNADLRNAGLSGAHLNRAHLIGARLIGAKLEGCRVGLTAILDLDLSTARGLEGVEHWGPSAIGHDTLEETAEGLGCHHSRRAEVEAFYRGAGVPEHLIEHYRARIGRPIEFFSAFISYSHADKGFARQLYDGLQMRGIRCWLDEHDLVPGDVILDVVNSAIRVQDKFILCCSEAGLESWRVEDEIEKALERERRENRKLIIPLSLDGYLLKSWNHGLASQVRKRLAAEFTGWEKDNAQFEEQFERVVRALRPREA